MPPTIDPVRQAVEQARARDDRDRQQTHETIARLRDQLQGYLTYAAELAGRIASYDAWLAANPEPEQPCAMAPYAPGTAAGISGRLTVNGPVLAGDFFVDNGAARATSALLASDFHAFLRAHGEG